MSEKYFQAYALHHDAKVYDCIIDYRPPRIIAIQCGLGFMKNNFAAKYIYRQNYCKESISKVGITGEILLLFYPPGHEKMF